MEQRRSAGQTPRAGLLARLRAAAARFKGNIFALHLAARDPRTPWYAKAVVGCVVAYAVSPVDLIPDVIPILGYVDDLLLLPIGIYIAMKLIPPEVLDDCHTKAAMGANLPRSWGVAVLIILIWLGTLAATAYWLRETFLRGPS
jgi:uncharacterized membrane protein YkvA (DUF1232 family)